MCLSFSWPTVGGGICDKTAISGVEYSALIIVITVIVIDWRKDNDWLWSGTTGG